MDAAGSTEPPVQGLSAEDEAIINEALNGLSLDPNNNEQDLEIDSEAVNEVIRQVLNDENFSLAPPQPVSDALQVPNDGSKDHEATQHLGHVKDAVISGGPETPMAPKTPEKSPQEPDQSASMPADPVTPQEKITQTISSGLDNSPEDDLAAFYKEFADKLTLQGDPKDPKEQTLILLSPLSYKHVFSRWWINKRYVSTIVERPQRLMACDLGIGAALSKFDGKFAMKSSSKRTRLDAPHVSKVHGTKWGPRIYQMCADSKALLADGKVEITDKDWNSNDIYLTEGTVDALEGVVGAVETAIDNLLGDHQQVQDKKTNFDQAFVTIRPPGHHSHPCVPSGFCLINNVHIGIQYAKAKYGLTHAVILDFDLHHGDGSQDICWKLMGFYDEEDEDDDEDNNDKQEDKPVKLESEPKRRARQSYAPQPPPADESDSQPQTPEQHKQHTTASPKKKKQPASPPKPEPAKETPVGIGYFSIHDIHSFPTELGYATAENIQNASVCLMAHGMCIWNVHLEPYDSEEDFYKVYDTKYHEIFHKAQQYLGQCKAQAAKQGLPFKAMVVISAGFDASEYEGVGMQRHGVHVPTSFYNRFTQDAQKLSSEFCDNKLLSLLEGGYSDQALSTGVFSHLSGLAKQQWSSSWIDAEIAKEFEKGCKLKWKQCGATFSQRRAHHANGAETVRWLEKSIKVGRSLWPFDIREQAQAASMAGATTTGRKAHGIDVLGQEVMATPSRVLRDRTKIQTPYRRVV